MTAKFVDRINVEKILKAAIILLLFFLLFKSLLFIPFGAGNVNKLRVFSTDEANAVRRVMRNLEKNDLNPRNFYFYGYIYQSTGYYLVKVMAYFKCSVDSKLVTMVFRLISLFSYILAGFLLYKLYMVAFGTAGPPGSGAKSAESATAPELYGLILVLFLLSLPAFYSWNRIVHPDMLQVALILLAALWAFSKHTFSNVLFASAAAGAAFGTKYSGIFILPFLCVPYILKTFNTEDKNKKFWLKITAVIILAIMIFLIVWLLTNPYVIKNFNEFQKDLSFQKKRVGRGHRTAESTNSLLWFSLLWKQLGTLNSIAAAAAILFLLTVLYLAFRKNGLRKFLDLPINRNLIAVILYVVFSFSYLMFEANLRRPRFILHILPFILLITVYGFHKSSTLFRKKFPRQLIVTILCISISLLTVNTLAKRIGIKGSARKYINAGDFLAETESSGTRILADQYSYVPPKFKHVTFSWGITDWWLKKYRPDILIINARTSRRYSWKRKGTSFKDLDFVTGSADKWRAYHKFQKKIFAPGSGWHIIYEKNSIVILKRNSTSLNKREKTQKKKK